MAFIRIVAERFAPHDPRISKVLSAVDLHLQASITHVQQVFHSQELQDRVGFISTWLSAGPTKVRAQVLSDGRAGSDQVLMTLTNRTDRTCAPGHAIGEVTLALGTTALATDLLARVTEAASDACTAIWAQAFHGPDQASMAMATIQAAGGDAKRALLCAISETGARVRADLGWLNYWNNRTAEMLTAAGVFPTIFAAARPSAQRLGWIAQLTVEPLSLSDGTHAARVGDAFREIEQSNATSRNGR